MVSNVETECELIVTVPVFVEGAGGRSYECVSCCLARNSVLDDLF